MAFWSELTKLGRDIFNILVNFYDGLTMPMSSFFGENTFLFGVVQTILSLFGINVANMSILGLIFSISLGFYVVLHLVRLFKSLF